MTLIFEYPLLFVMYMFPIVTWGIGERKFDRLLHNDFIIVLVSWAFAAILYSFYAYPAWFFYSASFTILYAIMRKEYASGLSFMLSVFATFSIAFLWEVPIFITNVSSIVFALPHLLALILFFQYFKLTKTKAETKKHLIILGTLLFTYIIGYHAVVIEGYLILPYVPLLFRFLWLGYFVSICVARRTSPIQDVYTITA